MSSNDKPLALVNAIKQLQDAVAGIFTIPLDERQTDLAGKIEEDVLSIGDAADHLIHGRFIIGEDEHDAVLALERRSYRALGHVTDLIILARVSGTPLRSFTKVIAVRNALESVRLATMELEND